MDDTTKKYHSTLSQCAELLPNMLDGDSIFDAPKFLAAHIAGTSQATNAQAEPEAYMTDDKRMLIFADAVTDLGKVGMRPLYAASVAKEALPEDVRKALQTIACWELPDTGKTWDDGSPMSYAACYGSNGERDYMRQIALDALDKLVASVAKEAEKEQQAHVMPPTRGTGSQLDAGWLGKISAGEYDRETGTMYITVKLPIEGLPTELLTIDGAAVIAPASKPHTAGSAKGGMHNPKARTLPLLPAP